MKLGTAIRSYLSVTSLALSGVLFIAILLAVLIQIVGRLLHFNVAGADDIARYAMAICGFVGLGFAALEGSHVRVELLITRLHGIARTVAEMLVYAIIFATLCYVTYYWLAMTASGARFADTAPGFLRMPLWLVQLPMAIGLLLLIVAVACMALRRNPAQTKEEYRGPDL